MRGHLAAELMCVRCELTEQGSLARSSQAKFRLEGEGQTAIRV